MRLKCYPRLYQCILGLALLLMLPSTLLAATENMNLSSELQTLIRQTESVYCSQFGKTANGLANNDPITFVSLVGLTLQRQGNYVDNNKQYIDNYWVLRRQCMDFFKKLALSKKNINPLGGGPMTYEILLERFEAAVSGKDNSFFIKSLGINPATVDTPMILAQVPVPNSQKTVTPNAKLVRRKNEIKLFGEVSPAAKSSQKPISYQGMADALAGPEKPQKIPVAKGVILGRWTGFRFYFGGDGAGEPKSDFYIEFSRGSGRVIKRKPEIYHGTSTNGTQYYVVSEKQVDQHTIIYEAYVYFPDSLTKKGDYSWMYRDCDKKLIEIEVASALIKSKGTKVFRTGVSLWKNDCRRFNPAFSYVK